MAHRYLICAAFAMGKSKIENLDFSDDIAATADCLKALGCKLIKEESTVTVQDGMSPTDGTVLNCRESGSTLRFLIPTALLFGKKITFTGSKRLFARPLEPYENLCREHGLEFEHGEDFFTVCGVLKAGTYTLPGNVSSQFASGLLFALPLLEQSSRIIFTSSVESRGYIDMTISALAVFGVRAFWSGEREITIPGSQKYLPTKVAVEGDYSNAAFFEAMNCLGSKIEITGLKENSLQGDSCCKRLFPLVCGSCQTADISACPDLAPVLFTLAAANNGGTFTGTRRLAYKESDRATAMKEELEKFGAKIRIEENSVTVEKAELHSPQRELCGHGDHRIVMALAVLCTVFGGKIVEAEAVSKSFPRFFDVMKNLGVRIESGENQ